MGRNKLGMLLCLLMSGQLRIIYSTTVFDFRVNVTLQTADKEDPMWKLRPCACKNRCFVQPSCMAFTVFEKSDGWWCRNFMTSQTPIYNFVPQEGTLLGYRRVGYPGTLESDGLFYFTPNDPVQRYRDAIQKCQEFPRYILARIKTLQAKDIAFKYCKNCPTGVPYTVIGLYKRLDGSILNTDLTPVTAEIEDLLVMPAENTYGAFVPYDGKLLFVSLYENELIPLCQGNFLAIII